MINKRLLVYFGFMLIILGLLGFLYTLKGGSVVSIGYAVVSNLEFKDQETETKKNLAYSYYSNNNFELEVLDIGRIISSPGNKKTISLNIKNTGKIFLNGCKILSEGETSSWIYPDQTEGIASGQKVNFIFNINIPDKISPGEYFIKLKIVCDEGEVKLKSFVVYITEGLKLIKIEKMKY